MFGGQAAQAAGAGRAAADQVEWHTPRRPAVAEPALELERVTVAPGQGEIGADAVSAPGVAQARSWASPASTATGSASWQRRSRGSARSSAGDIRLFGRLDLARLKVAQRERLGPPLCHRRPPRRGHGGLALGRHEHRAEAIGEAAVLASAVASVTRRSWSARRVELIDRFDIRTPGPETRVGALSGGNVQKVVLARELSHDPRLVVYNKPTYGLDMNHHAERARDDPGAGRTRA